jgi:hypothetical protein
MDDGGSQYKLGPERIGVGSAQVSAMEFGYGVERLVTRMRYEILQIRAGMLAGA